MSKVSAKLKDANLGFNASMNTYAAYENNFC